MSRALTMRLALYRLLTDATAISPDPTLAARLNAEVDAVRAEAAT